MINSYAKSKEIKEERWHKVFILIHPTIQDYVQSLCTSKKIFHYNQNLITTTNFLIFDLFWMLISWVRDKQWQATCQHKSLNSIPLLSPKSQSHHIIQKYSIDRIINLLKIHLKKNIHILPICQIYNFINYHHTIHPLSTRNESWLVTLDNFVRHQSQTRCQNLRHQLVQGLNKRDWFEIAKMKGGIHIWDQSHKVRGEAIWKTTRDLKLLKHGTSILF